MEKERREVASLTKIMTLYTSLQLIDKYELDFKTEFITVCDEVAEVTGTSANLLTGDKLTIE
jgi:D-alanyl-D-alanine carboxypeptidase